MIEVSAVVVTRGDVGLDLESLDFLREVIVWDNSKEELDLAVYGRYAAIDRARSPVVYVQDDDVVLPRASIEALLAAYEPGKITANMPERFRHDFYVDHCLVGFGAIFDRDLPLNAFRRFVAGDPTRQTVAEWNAHQPSPLPSWANDAVGLGENFYRTCDVVFTALTPRALVDLPYADREFASDPNRMWRQPSHVGERQKTLDLARAVRDAS